MFSLFLFFEQNITTMKQTKNTLFLAAAVIIALNFQSCGKYEDGPNFSLRTKKNRIAGDWEVVRIGNQNQLQGYSVEMSFDKDGDFDMKTEVTYSYGPYGGTTYNYSQSGEWEFSRDKEEIEITLENQIIEFEILRLTKDELWMEDQDNNEWRLEAD